MAYDTKNPYPREGEGAYIEYVSNGTLLASMFEMTGQVVIPSNFDNGRFNSTETGQKARFMNVKLTNNTGTNNGETIVLNAGQSFTLDCTVFLGLFKSWKQVKIEGTGINVQIALKNKDGTLIRNVSNGENLTNYNIDDDEVKVTVTANAACTINNIILEVNTSKLDNSSSVKIPQEQITGLKSWEESKDTQINNIDADKVPKSRKINNKTLDKDITLTNADIGSQPKFKTVTQDVTLKSAGVNTNIQIINSGSVYRAYCKYNGYGMPYSSTSYGGYSITSNGGSYSAISNAIKVLKVEIKNTTSSYLTNMATNFILVERGSLRFDIFFNTNDLSQSAITTAFNDIVAKPIVITVTYLVYE